MIIFYAAVHRDMFGQVKRLVKETDISALSAFEHFRKRKDKSVDKGFKLILKVRKRVKNGNHSK